ncbi:hypothetical protein APS56_11725 [Pseudalgibacter alginicilyticus]|uniref:TonB-dependent receptor n=1 Tax=Pseudalgibacter alginicilyticus TaxID=1736674 RepID=A0A0P0CHT8_9FLAO|nr:hypothetical protein [Pseudalgibacter alginicilyticus]ALJ05753.1 hypothetical protein APS56_11725 [Pseudalgibacter alginicilyticus]
MKYFFSILIFFICFCGMAQEPLSNYKTKKVAVNDTIVIENFSINSNFFIIKNKDKSIVDSTFYSIDFSKATLIFQKPIETDSVIINYLRFPDFLTKTYQQLDENIIVENTNRVPALYKLSPSNNFQNTIPFDGLTTSGSISRGVTLGNNQNSVLNSELDLQITGKLNDKVSLRASIQDANIPLQESGYSQRLDEFDQVFIELFSDKWNIRAGDIDLQNTDSYFANFSKRVQGLSINTMLDDEDTQANLFAAGALVRGQFTTSQFTAQEGNQGPYKLQGQNGELFVLIVSGSEMVYVNGVLAQRGEDKDYIIDYNAGEIIFNSTFPITSEMRITVDYQFSERNYSRLVAYGGGRIESKKFNVGVSVYSENDSKNQPLQQNLSEEQAQILSEAGDDTTLMVAPSEVLDAYSENRILYKKEFIGSEEVYVFSNNPDDELYRVTFSQVGDNQGDYVLSNINAINNIYEYAGVLQGNYAPIVQLVAPVKLQIAVVNGDYHPTEKTQINFEIAGSKNDLNLFSSANDEDNDGFATKLNINQFLIKTDTLWNLKAFLDADYIHTNFRNIEGLYNAEFNRDWNLDQTNTNGIGYNLGNQILMQSGMQLYHPEKGMTTYQFEHLSYSDNFNGNRHVVNINLLLDKFNITSYSSLLNAESNLNTSTFLRSYNRFTFSMKKSWIGTKLAFEDNKQKTIATQELTDLSQKYNSYELFTGIGDSTQVFVEIGYKHRVNDSIRNNQLQKVNSSNTFYLDSRIIQNKNTNLSLYANYRVLKNTDAFTDTSTFSTGDEQSINSRLQYRQNFFKQIIQWNTVFETNSGTLPQQDFTYVEVESGQGTYTWIDYNANSIQELEEFELAQFQDQGKYIRVLLPNRVFIKTHQNRWSQTVTLNPAQWAVSENKSEKFWSHFYNQTSYLIDRKVNRDDNNTFNINPFKKDIENQLGLQLNFKNALFFNRGKQRFTTSYTVLNNKTRSILTTGFIENNLISHQFNFNHKFEESWLVNLESSFDSNESISENFTSKNYNFNETRFNPKLSYLLNDNTRFDVYYQFTNKENTIGDFELLEQQKYGVSFSLANSQNNAINGEINYFSNGFEGNSNTPVAYQMLEGLQPGKNFTWSFLAQKKLTTFLDLNLSYFGRKTETSKVIHTGNVQLKAYF